MFFGDQKSPIRGFIEWIFYFFIALFPFILYRGYLFNGTATRSINTVIIIEILAIIFGFALFSKRKNFAIAKSPITLSLLIFFIVMTISALFGADFSISFWSKATRTTGLFYFTHIALFYLLLFQLFTDERKLRSLIKVFIVSSGVFSIISQLGSEGWKFMFKDKDWDGFTFGNSTFAAMYLLTAFLLSVYYLYTQSRENRRWWKYLLPLIIVINPYFINRKLWTGEVNVLQNPLGIIGEAQASTYALAFSILALIAVWTISKIKSSVTRRKIAWGLAALAIVVAIVAIRSFLTDGGKLREAYLATSSTSRPIVWELSDAAIRDKSALGWGIDNFDRAFQANYDNRLLEQKNGNEPWFDRAHNIFIDQVVDTGYIGLGAYLLVYLAILGSLFYVLLRGERKWQTAAVFLLVYFIAHLMELQTAFDTSISYIPLTIMAAFAAVIFHQTYQARSSRESEWVTPSWLQCSIGIMLIGWFGWAFFAGAVPIAHSEATNGKVRLVGSAARRLELYPALFSSPLDQASFLWRTSTDFQRGIAENPKVVENPKNVELFSKELEVFANGYERYLESHPQEYRAWLNLADIYIYMNLFTVNRLNDAHVALDKALMLVPQAPQAYWMKAVAYLYQGKFDLAREWARKGLELNPNIEESQKLANYIERSIRSFPEIELYFFRSI